MYSSSNTNIYYNSSPSSPQPHKKRKISSEKTKQINYLQSTQKPSYPLKNKKKRRLENMKSSLNNYHSSTNKISLSMDNNSKNENNVKYSNKATLKEQVEPWWIGQRIVVNISDSDNPNNSIFREAIIRDYYPYKKLTHIWFETEDNNVENVDLLNLEDWEVANNKPLYEQIEFVPDNDWIPVYWKMKQRVLVRFDGEFGNGLHFAAFIDGYDPISRRHHINYGDATEWIWATKERVKIYNGKKCDDHIEEKRKRFRINRDEIEPPPWNPTPYGLDEAFAIKSKQTEKNRLKQIAVKRNNKSMIRSKNKTKGDGYNRLDDKNTNQAAMKIFGNKTHPRRNLSNTAMNGAEKRINPLMRKSSSFALDKLLEEYRKTKKGNNFKAGSNSVSVKNGNVNGPSNAKKEKQQHSNAKCLDANNNIDNATTISSSTNSSSGSTFSGKTYRSMSDSDSDTMLSPKDRRRQRLNANNSNTNLKTARNSYMLQALVQLQTDIRSKEAKQLMSSPKNNKRNQNGSSISKTKTKNIETDTRITMKPTNSNNNNNDNNPQQHTIPLQPPIVTPQYSQIPVTTRMNTINGITSIIPASTANGTNNINIVNRVNGMNGGNQFNSCISRNRINGVVQAPMTNPSHSPIFVQLPSNNNNFSTIQAQTNGNHHHKQTTITNPNNTFIVPSQPIVHMNNIPIHQPMKAKIISNTNQRSNVIQPKVADNKLNVSKMTSTATSNVSPTTSSSIDSKAMYPRTAIIDGNQWVRHYSPPDRRYYWLLTNDENDIISKEWDPWRKHGLKAPWMSSKQKWYTFKDPTEKKQYFYNYDTKQSTFHRPDGYISDPQIEYDSADNDNNNQNTKN